jgi:hypothetical protein
MGRASSSSVVRERALHASHMRASSCLSIQLFRIVAAWCLLPLLIFVVPYDGCFVSLRFCCSSDSRSDDVRLSLWGVALCFPLIYHAK